MDYTKRLAISYYETIATINDEHKIYLVKHRENQKICIKKILSVYNLQVYQYLQNNHIEGTPHIIDFYEENNELTVIEEYISGESLQDIIDNSKITIKSIIQYISELCDILMSLHTTNPPIVHRDIKPSNIIITYNNNVVLLDFNASKHYISHNKTDTVLLGTKGYAAPEQYGFGSSSPLTDIYAVGVLLEELSSSLPQIPTQISKIIKKCTEINPGDRYQSVIEIKKQISNLYSNRETISFVPPGFRTKTPRKMLLSSIGYLLMIYSCLPTNFDNKVGLASWNQSIFCFLMMLSIVFCCFNYLDIRSILPICKNESRLKRYLGVFALICMFIIVLSIGLELSDSFIKSI